MRLVRVTSLYLGLIISLVSMTACGPAEPPPPPPPPPPGDLSIPPEISISPSDNFTILLGRLDTVSARLRSPGAAIRFRSSQPSIVRVDSITGVIRGMSLGTATITAARAGAMSTASAVDVTVLSPEYEMSASKQREMVQGMVAEVCMNRAETALIDSLPPVDLRIIHEFHDCQRLIERRAYGPVVGIYAHRNLTTYPSPEDYVGGRLAAIIVNFGFKQRTAEYGPLGLRPGATCLVLKWNPEAKPSSAWQAALVHTSSLPGGECRDSTNWSHVPTPQPTALDVWLQPNATGPDTLRFAPPVARWDWDDSTGVNYIGVRCGETAWCEIGPSGFKPRESLVMANGWNMFKGFYDEQYLAHWDGTLTDVFGRVSPPESAVKLQRNGAWHKVATIEITSRPGSAAYKYYKDRMKLKDQSNFPTGKVRSGGIMTMMSHPLPNPPQNATQDQRNWNVRINGRYMDTQKPKEKMTHRSHPSEGESRYKNVRWRWDDEDERVWGYCPEVGCCESGRLQPPS